MTNSTISTIKQRLQSGFFGFRIKQWRFTFLIMILIIIGGIFSMTTITKEAMPEIDYGVISITTIYQGASPQDIDNLITDPVEQEIKDIAGIKKITSTSRVGVSSIMIELDNDADVTQTLVDMKDAVDKLSLPTDAEDPIVTDISTDTKRMFVLLLSAPEDKYDLAYLYKQAKLIEQNIQQSYRIDSVDIGGVPSVGGEDLGASDEDFFEIHVLLDQSKIESLGLSLMQVQQAIRNRNTNQPLGSQEIGKRGYELRIQGEITDLPTLENITLPTPQAGTVTIGQIATIKEVLKSDNNLVLFDQQNTGQHFVSLTINKPGGTDIFTASEHAKKILNEELRKPIYDGLGKTIVLDLAEEIGDDYQDLSKSGLQTLLFVFLALFVFVGLKESVIATFSIPLSFFIAFIVLQQLGLSLNFLTNFSFLIAFGVAIDTTLIIVEGAHEKMSQGFHPKTAILLAIRDYKLPVIAGTATTVVVFIPLLTLPGVMGKFLAFIPITIFATLVAALFVALTIIGVLFYKFSKNSRRYNPKESTYMSSEDKALREAETKDKEPHTQEDPPEQKNIFGQLVYLAREQRHELIKFLRNWYDRRIHIIFKTKTRRVLTIIVPLLLLVGSIRGFSGMIGFEMMPKEDNNVLMIDIERPVGTTVATTENLISSTTNQSGQTFFDIMSDLPELKVGYVSIGGNEVRGTAELTPIAQREEQGQRDVFALQKTLSQDFSFLEAQGRSISLEAPENGPPGGSSVAIKLHSYDNSQFDELINVAKDFSSYLKTLDGTINVSLSSKTTPGQFVYTFDEAILHYLGLTPQDIQRELYGIINGIGAGTIKLGKNNDTDIVVKYKSFDEGVDVEKINNIMIPTSRGEIMFDSVSKVSFESALDSIKREDTQITVTVGAETDESITPDKIQAKLLAFAQDYEYPSGIFFSAGGEQQENADLNQAMVMAFITALFVIFGILVLQFNSFSQPIIIMFSVLMGLFGANVGLVLTGNSYGMMFGIGFIALTGIVVNDAIVLIDKANRNRKNGMPLKEATMDAGKSRLQPIILTTLTTVLGLASMYGQAMFQPLVVTVMFGLTVASSMTLFVIPVLYYGRERLRKKS